MSNSNSNSNSNSQNRLINEFKQTRNQLQKLLEEFSLEFNITNNKLNEARNKLLELNLLINQLEGEKQSKPIALLRRQLKEINREIKVGKNSLTNLKKALLKYPENKILYIQLLERVSYGLNTLASQKGTVLGKIRQKLKANQPPIANKKQRRIQQPKSRI